MSVLDPVDRAGWLGGVAALEDAGEPVTDRTLACHLRQRRAHTRHMIARLRDAGLLAGVGRVRLSAIGRYYLGRPVLVYLVPPLNPIEPWASAAGARDAADELVAGIGAPAIALMPSLVTMAAAATAGAALEAVAAIAVRADVVLVPARDPLVQVRADVVAAERADVMVMIEPIEIAASVIRESLARAGQRP